MGMEELILDLEIMSNIYQSQIHNLKLARQCVIEDQKPVPDPKSTLVTLSWSEITPASQLCLSIKQTIV